MTAITVTGDKAMGGAYDGASRLSRELATWNPGSRSADQDINGDKLLLDARGRDLGRNDGFVSGAADIHKDSIVGTRYMLNARPNLKVLSAINPAFNDAWAEELQQVVEAKFSLYAESPDNWVDAQRLNTLTEMVRLAVGCYFYAGEVLASVEWMRSSARPFATALQMIDPDRLSNPNGQADSRFLRRGIERDRYGAPLAYHIRQAHPGESFMDSTAWNWKRVPVRKPWGRLQIIHIFEQQRPDQSRGLAGIVAVLKEMKMTKKFQDVVLQNAVLNASYAAAIESELPADVVYAQLGEGQSTALEAYLTALKEYAGNSKSLHIDGVKIPHLFPGTKLHMQPAGNVGGVGTDFEKSLLRHVAAGLGLSYEQFSRDYTETNYSSARASMGETHKYMMARKKMVADRFASMFYCLWFEEAMNMGELPMPAGIGPEFFYQGQNKDALTACDWIGASRGQIDELKETQAAVLRIKAGLSTYEQEAARLGHDWRELFDQRAREDKIIADKGLSFNADPTKDGGLNSSSGNPDQKRDDKQDSQSDDNAQYDALMALAGSIGDAVKSMATSQPAIHVAPPSVHVDAPQVNVTTPPVSVNVDAKPRFSGAVKFDTDENGTVTGATTVVDGKPTKAAFVFDTAGNVTGVEMTEVSNGA